MDRVLNTLSVWSQASHGEETLLCGLSEDGVWRERSGATVEVPPKHFHSQTSGVRASSGILGRTQFIP